MSFYSYFNSTMVRLKVRYRQDAHSVLSFQFHYGTIKSIGRTFHFRFIVVFQFHYGTIKRLITVTRTPESYYFNSTMVRLKVYFCVPRAGMRMDFNSTMVRLKGVDVRGVFHTGNEFQFHYGTIKSFCLVNVVTLVEYFNSTMVRLKVWWNYVLPFDS